MAQLKLGHGESRSKLNSDVMYKNLVDIKLILDKSRSWTNLAQKRLGPDTLQLSAD